MLIGNYRVNNNMSRLEEGLSGEQFRKETNYVKVTLDSPQSLGNFLSGLRKNGLRGRFEQFHEDIIIVGGSAILTVAQYERCLDGTSVTITTEDVDHREVKRIYQELASRDSIND